MSVSSYSCNDSRVLENGGREDALDIHPLLVRLAALLPVRDLTSPEESGMESELADEAAFDSLPEQIARILFRSKRGHALVTGLRGVGKTSVIRQFARRAGRGKFPFLRDHKILLLDVSNVGPDDSKACLEFIFEAISGLDNLVLCLDGIASLMKRGPGGTNKPLMRALLNRNRLKVIGTMTGWEYAEHVGGDAQMLEVFTRLDLAEPSGTELNDIVIRAGRALAEEYLLDVPPAVAETSIAVTSTFLLSEAHPAKAIDVLREACEEMSYVQTQRGLSRKRLGVEDIIEVVARRTGIPRETINGKGRTCDFETTLADAVVGQEAAVREVAMELELISAGLTEPGKPASVMMFTGMTGVGKTELAKRIAELYSTSRRVQVYSMGNFTEPHSVSGIIGVPPGYVGHEEGGRLINELRADPYSVFLLDEAEKCHPNVWKPFLNLFDEGWIVDQRGIKAYADRAIFILTTNAGDRNISQLTRSGKSPEEIIQNVKQALSRVRQERSSQPVFPPQFLSRMKRILVFGPLGEAAMRGIAECASRRLSRRWQTSRGKQLTLTPELVRRIGSCAHRANERSNGQEGGRIVQKLLGDHVEHAIYRKSLEDRGAYESCRGIQVSLNGDAPDDQIQSKIAFL